MRSGQSRRQTHRHTDTQTHRHTDTQTHRHTDTQTEQTNLSNSRSPTKPSTRLRCTARSSQAWPLSTASKSPTTQSCDWLMVSFCLPLEERNSSLQNKTKNGKQDARSW